jgi:ankyrin repeat protein
MFNTYQLNSALHIAASNGSTEAIAAMLGGLSPETKTLVVNTQAGTSNYTPLHLAAAAGNREMATLLLANEANATLRCHMSSRKFKTMIQCKGATAADMARNNNHKELGRFLQKTKDTQRPPRTWRSYITANSATPNRGHSI